MKENVWNHHHQEYLLREFCIAWFSPPTKGNWITSGHLHVWRRACGLLTQCEYWRTSENISRYHPWESETKQKKVFNMIQVKDSVLPRGKVWSLDFWVMLSSKPSQQPDSYPSANDEPVFKILANLCFLPYCLPYLPTTSNYLSNELNLCTYSTYLLGK